MRSLPTLISRVGYWITTRFFFVTKGLGATGGRTNVTAKEWANVTGVMSPTGDKCRYQPLSIVGFDWPFDNLGFLSKELGQMLLYVVRS
jgi:hypothetical protein